MCKEDVQLTLAKRRGAIIDDFEGSSDATATDAEADAGADMLGAEPTVSAETSSPSSSFSQRQQQMLGSSTVIDQAFSSSRGGSGGGGSGGGGVLWGFRYR